MGEYEYVLGEPFQLSIYFLIVVVGTPSPLDPRCQGSMSPDPHMVYMVHVHGNHTWYSYMYMVFNVGLCGDLTYSSNLAIGIMLICK